MAPAGDWEVVPVYAGDRLLSRWHGRRLDMELAAGRPAAGSRLRAVRASRLVAPSWRRMMAAGWENLLTGEVLPQVPVCWPAVNAARADIEQLVDALRTAHPVPARGVAIAHLLLCDGTGPLFVTHAERELREGVRSALHHMDPLHVRIEG